MSGSVAADESTGPGDDRDATRILFVCTANRCRSVLAEAFARRRFAGRPFIFASAGFLESGRPMPPAGLLVAAENGLDMSGHLSQRIEMRRLAEWDLVLTMSRRHTRELVATDPGLWPRVFTLPQFVRWLDAHPPGRHAVLRTWIELLGSDRNRSEMVGSRPEDEIADPVDGPPAAWRELVTTLTTDLDRIADRLIPTAGGGGSDTHPSGHSLAEGRAVEELRAIPAGRRVHRDGRLDGTSQLRGIGGAEQ